MNDRYLYRAKRIDNGEWAEGFYVNAIEEHGNGERTAEIVALDAMRTFGGISPTLMVDPSTICQCTGLKDKNGKLIWENDICRRILLPTKRIKTIFRIAYVPYKCCLSAIDLDGSNVTFLSDYINNQYEVEVIGSAIDNPELLEVGE